MRIPRRTCVRLAIVAYATGGGTDSGTEKAEPQRFWPLLPFKRCAAPVLASKTEDRLLKRKVTKWKRCTFEAFVPRFQAGADKYAAIEGAISSCRDKEEATAT